MITPSDIRADTIALISGLSSLSEYTFYNAPMTQIDELSIPSISVYVLSESAESLYHRDPSFSVQFDLTIEIAYKAGVAAGNLNTKWSNEVNSAEQSIFDALYTNEAWLDAFDEVQGFTIERQLVNESNYLMALSTIVIPCQVTLTYEANR